MYDSEPVVRVLYKLAPNRLRAHRDATFDELKLYLD